MGLLRRFSIDGVMVGARRVQPRLYDSTRGLVSIMAIALFAGGAGRVRFVFRRAGVVGRVNGLVIG